MNSINKHDRLVNCYLSGVGVTVYVCVNFRFSKASTFNRKLVDKLAMELL